MIYADSGAGYLQLARITQIYWIASVGCEVTSALSSVILVRAIES